MLATGAATQRRGVVPLLARSCVLPGNRATALQAGYKVSACGRACGMAMRRHERCARRSQPCAVPSPSPARRKSADLFPRSHSRRTGPLCMLYGSRGWYGPSFGGSNTCSDGATPRNETYSVMSVEVGEDGMGTTSPQGGIIGTSRDGRHRRLQRHHHRILACVVRASKPVHWVPVPGIATRLRPRDAPLHAALRAEREHRADVHQSTILPRLPPPCRSATSARRSLVARISPFARARQRRPRSSLEQPR